MSSSMRVIPLADFGLLLIASDVPPPNTKPDYRGIRLPPPSATRRSLCLLSAAWRSLPRTRGFPPPNYLADPPRSVAGTPDYSGCGVIERYVSTIPDSDE